jgi:O-antigen biosynthesis protein
VKIVFLTSNYPPEAIAGTEQVVTGLARELRALGGEIAAITSSDVVHFGQDVGREQFEGVAVHRLWKKLGEWDHDGFVRPRLLGLVRELLQELRPDLVHVHSFAALGAGCLRVCRELGIPVVLSFHDLWVVCARYFRLPSPGLVCPSGADRTPCIQCIDHALQAGPAAVAGLLAQRDAALREEVSLAAACIAPSNAAARFVREGLPYADQIHVVPHGLLRPVPAERRSEPPRAREVLRIGTFGGLVAEKGVFELVQAVAGLPCELHLAGTFGDPEFAAAVRTQAAQQGTVLRERGRYGPEDRHPARDLHLAVFPSKCQETYGLVVDEALAHGVPTVVSDAGALAERASTPGVVVTPLSRLAPVLHDLARSPAALAQLRANVPASMPTIAASAAFHFDLYRSLLRRSS